MSSALLKRNGWDYFCTAVFGLVNASGYSQSAYNSFEQYGSPLELTWVLIGVFSVGLTVAIANGYSKDVVDLRNRIADKCCCDCGCCKPESITRSNSQPLNDVSSDSMSDESTPLKEPSEKKTPVWLAACEWVGASGKAVISNSSMFRFFNHEMSEIGWMSYIDMHWWFPSILLPFTLISTFASQFAVLKNARLRGKLKDYLPKYPIAMARLANFPGTIMYFDTARKLIKLIGFLTEDYAPWYSVVLLSLFSACLIISGDDTFKCKIERLLGIEETKTLESKIIKTPYLGTGVQLGSIVMKSFTGELAFILFLDNLAKNHAPDEVYDSILPVSLLLTVMPILITTTAYYFRITKDTTPEATAAVENSENNPMP